MTLSTAETVGTTVLLTGATRKTIGRSLRSSRIIGVVNGLMGRHGRDTTVCARRGHTSLTRPRLTRTTTVRGCLPGTLSRRRIRTTMGTVVTRMKTASVTSVNGIVNATAGGLTNRTSNQMVSTVIGGLLTWGGSGVDVSFSGYLCETWGIGRVLLMWKWSSDLVTSYDWKYQVPN